MLKTYNHDHTAPFEAFITNLGKYNEGELVGEWLPLPASEEEVSACLKRIGIGSCDDFGQPYEEYFITDYDNYVSNLKLDSEYISIEKLNELANAIEELDAYDYEKFTAVLDIEYTESVNDILELINNLDNYDYLEGVNNDYDLGYYYVEEAGIYDLSNLGCLAYYIDYERFGRDIRLEEGGGFTDNGYIRSY